MLVYFSATGDAHFASHPANELFNLSISVSDIFDKKSILMIEEKLSLASGDSQCIKISGVISALSAYKHPNR